METVKFDADVWSSMLSLDLHHVLSVLNRTIFLGGELAPEVWELPHMDILCSPSRS